MCVSESGTVIPELFFFQQKAKQEKYHVGQPTKKRRTGATACARKINCEGALFAVGSGYEVLIEQELDSFFEVTKGAHNQVALTFKYSGSFQKLWLKPFGSSHFVLFCVVCVCVPITIPAILSCCLVAVVLTAAFVEIS